MENKRDPTERIIGYLILGFIIGGVSGLGMGLYAQNDFMDRHQCFTNELYENISAYQLYCAINLNVSYEEVNEWWNSPISRLNGKGIYVINQPDWEKVANDSLNE